MISSNSIVISIFKSINEDLQRVDCLKVTADKYQPVKNALLVGVNCLMLIMLYYL